MTSGLRAEFAEVSRHFLAATTGADAALRKLLSKLLAADPEETLVGSFDDRTELSLSAGWIASRVAFLERQSSDVVTLETAAALIAVMFEDPATGAAKAGLLQKWPSAMSRLVMTSRERINGAGEPHGRVGRELSASAQRVAIAVEAARRLSIAGGKLEQVYESFEREAKRGYWDPKHVETIPAAIAGLSKAFDDRRLAPVRARTYRISPAHAVEAPHTLEIQKKRQRIANRHVAFTPVASRGRSASVRASLGAGVPRPKRRGGAS